MERQGRIATAAAIAEINITPLIDVLLVLLIIFMVVTPVAQRSIDTALPQPAPPPPPGVVEQPKGLVLEIENTGLVLNRTPVASLEDLDERLRAALEGRPDKTLFVRASGQVTYGRVVEALDVARGAGVGRIGIVGQGALAADTGRGAS